MYYPVAEHAHTDTMGGGKLTPVSMLMPSIDVPSAYDLATDFTTRGSSGVLDGTLVYVGVGTTAVKISVAAGEGFIRTTNDQQGTLIKCNWAASVDLYTFSAPATGFENVRFIGVEYSGGAVTAVSKASITDWNWYTNFPLARCSYDGTSLRILNAYAHSEDTANFTRKFLRLTHPFSREEAPEGAGGLELSSSALALALSGGKIWHGFNNYTIAARSSGTVFDTHYKRAGGGFNRTIGVTAWPNTQYDDASGTLATMTVGRYGTLWVYLDVSDGTLDVVYGAVNATSVALAQEDTRPTIPDHLTYHGRLIARIIYQKSAGTATRVESAWTAMFNPTIGSGDALVANSLSQFAATTSAQLAGVISDETGSGLLVFATSPVLTTPNIGTPSAGVLSSCTGLPTTGLVDDAVTYAKMQNVSASRLLGRGSAGGAGDPEEITLGAGLSMTTTALNIAGTAQTYTETNVTPDRTFDANATTLDELADVVGTLIADLRSRGIIAS